MCNSTNIADGDNKTSPSPRHDTEASHAMTLISISCMSSQATDIILFLTGDTKATRAPSGHHTRVSIPLLSPSSSGHRTIRFDKTCRIANNRRATTKASTTARQIHGMHRGRRLVVREPTAQIPLRRRSCLQRDGCTLVRVGYGRKQP
jgi:hypothetical protein